jgi:O-6-methylguanine DNA methyltransferase
MKYYDMIYNLVREIPTGRVMTYGQIAFAVGTGPRVVGNILHKNVDPKNIPCHRVIKYDGSLAGGYAFGGSDTQQEMLEKEGIVFERGKVDLGKYLYQR